METQRERANTLETELDRALDGAPTVRRARPLSRWDWDGQPEQEHREREMLLAQVERLTLRAAELERRLVTEQWANGDLARALDELAEARPWHRRAVLRSIRLQGLLRGT